MTSEEIAKSIEVLKEASAYPTEGVKAKNDAWGARQSEFYELRHSGLKRLKMQSQIKAP